MLEMWDARYGTVVVETTDDGRGIVVYGDDVPTASITRTGTSEIRSDVPIGTRDGQHLQLLLDGEEYAVRPGRGRFSRRSYRVRVSGHGHEWLFAPATPSSHRLVKGSGYRGDNELGMFTADEASITAEWSTEIRIAGMVAGAPDSTSSDCALGFVLAAAFGTGARLMMVAIASAAADAFFPG